MDKMLDDLPQEAVSLSRVRPSVSFPGSTLRESETTGLLYAALCAAQVDIVNPAKNKKVSAGPKQYSYADLPTVLDVVRGALSGRGIAFVQPFFTVDGRTHLVTKLIHAESGEWVESGFMLPQTGASPQDFGILLTYYRRYGLSAFVGIAGAEDEDGNLRSRERRTQDEVPEKAKAAAHAAFPEVRDGTRDAIMRRLVKGFRGAENAGDVLHYLKHWNEVIGAFFAVRDNDEAWSFVATEIGVSLGRVMGRAFQALFVASMRVQTADHLNKLDELIEKKYAADLSELKERDAALHAAVAQHLQNVTSRMERRLGIKKPDATTHLGGLNNAGDLEEQIDAEVAAFCFPLRDAYGEVISSPYTDAAKFVAAYWAIYDHTDMADVPALNEHNAEAMAAAEELGAVSQTAEPAVVAAEPEQDFRLTLVPPNGERMNLATAISKVATTLKGFTTIAQTRAFRAANSAEIAKLPPTTQSTIAARIDERERQIVAGEG